jgi:hypothetical protein
MTTAEFFHQALNPDNKPSPVILGNFGRKNLAKLLNKAALLKGVEVGVADGRHAELLCHSIASLELMCVDPWQRYRGNPRGGPQEQHDGNYEKAKDKLLKFGCRLIRKPSMEAVVDVPLGSLDFAYIDGNHSFDYVMPDIIEWGKRVRVDGVIAGHDYYPFKWAGVIEAVNAYVTAHYIDEWFVTEEREPTWFFVKGPEKHPHRGW